MNNLENVWKLFLGTGSWAPRTWPRSSMATPLGPRSPGNRRKHMANCNYATPLGMRLSQNANDRRIDNAVAICEIKLFQNYYFNFR